MAVERSASAVWEGDLKSGSGTLESQTGNVSGAYTWASRWEDGSGTNPEELIASAHAACFAMAFASALDKAGHPPTKVEASAAITLDGGDITSSALTCTAEVEGIDEDSFQSIAQDAKKGCPVSKALAGVDITLDATLA